MLPEVERWQDEHAERVTFAVVSRGAPDQVRAKFDGHALEFVLVQREREVTEAYRISLAPSAIIVRADGAIGSVPANGPAAIRRIVEMA